MRSTTVPTLLQDIELVPENQDFDLQLPWRFEAVAQHADEQEADCNHSRSCSDSSLAASQRIEFSEATANLPDGYTGTPLVTGLIGFDCDLIGRRTTNHANVQDTHSGIPVGGGIFIMPSVY